ncbi:MAG TPA: hypothetical protein VGF29_05885 [Hyphomicrobiaceae bacterium]|jgi:hypothetical protein
MSPARQLAIALAAAVLGALVVCAAIAWARVPPAAAGECCVFPGRDAACVPCRPTRGAA